MIVVGLVISPSSEVVYAVSMPGVMAGVVTNTWFSQLLAEFHTYITSILKLAKAFVQSSTELLDCFV